MNKSQAKLITETAEGTSGKAGVKTRSEVDIKSIVVESVKPTGAKCSE